MADTRYGQYILHDAVTYPVFKNRKHLPSFSGKEELWSGITGMNCNFGLNCVTEPYLLPDPPHKHDFDEYLLFIGGNPLNMKEFDAVIEIALGEEWELHTITSTSIIYIPRGLQHCPVNVKRVGKPFLFGHIMLSEKYGNDSEAGDLFERPEKNTENTPQGISIETMNES
ncbi:MAG: hypothetical protein JXA46_02775 [Dehalococcoidales bacterium]|nr:hypothetical protein [Dehalococcoidales bacterium]